MVEHVSSGNIRVPLSEPGKTRFVFVQEEGTRLGRLALAAYIDDGLGILPMHTMRVYGAYAVVAICSGRGRYVDANGVRADVVAGDFILVFPDLPHIYNPDPGTRWDEFFVVFDGPVFDFWRSAGLLDSTKPVVRGIDLAGLQGKLEALASEPHPRDDASRLSQVMTLLGHLTALAGATSPSDTPPEHRWLAKSRQLLDQDLRAERPVQDIAIEVGLSYENFRKRFAAETGVSPFQYREARRVRAAQELLRFTQMTNSQIAEQLGYADEFHFSKRFRSQIGLAPRAFRRREA